MMRIPLLLAFMILLFVAGCSEREPTSSRPGRSEKETTRSWTEFFSASSLCKENGKLVFGESTMHGSKGKISLFNSIVGSKSGVSDVDGLVCVAALGSKGAIVGECGIFNAISGETTFYKKPRVITPDLVSGSFVSSKGDEMVYYPKGDLSAGRDISKDVDRVLPPNDIEHFKPFNPSMFHDNKLYFSSHSSPSFHYSLTNSSIKTYDAFIDANSITSVKKLVGFDLTANSIFGANYSSSPTEYWDYQPKLLRDYLFPKKQGINLNHYYCEGWKSMFVDNEGERIIVLGKYSHYRQPHFKVLPKKIRDFYATGLLTLSESGFDLVWAKSNVDSSELLPQYFFAEGTLKALVYDGWETSVYLVNPSNGALLIAESNTNLPGQITLKRYLGKNKYLAETDFRKIKRLGNRYCNFDIFDVSTSKTLFAKSGDLVFPGRYYSFSGHLFSNDKKSAIRNFPDEIGILSECGEFRILKPAKGWYFIQVTTHGETGFRVLSRSLKREENSDSTEIIEVIIEPAKRKQVK